MKNRRCFSTAFKLRSEDLVRFSDVRKRAIKNRLFRLAWKFVAPTVDQFKCKGSIDETV